MNVSALLLLLGVFAVIFTASVPLGLYMSALFDGSVSRRFRWMERTEALFLYPLGESGRKPMLWHEYAASLVMLTSVCALFAYLVLRLQHLLPGNPLGLPAVSPDLAFNTAVSFATSTTWQSYAGEASMSLFSQAACLSVLTFFASSIGVVAAFAFARGLVQSRTQTVGNAWTDLVRCILWFMVPLSFVIAMVLVWQGSVQTFEAETSVTTLEGAVQKIAVGPVASQEALRLISVTGGSFYAANSAHPFVTPSAAICFMQIILMLIVAAALVFAYGKMTGNVREGFSILFGMSVLFAGAFLAVAYFESGANPLVTAQGAAAGLGNMEGKEVRFGPVLTSLFATTSAASSAGAAAGSFDSLLPPSGAVILWLIQAGDVIFGGARSGLYTMLGLAIVAVFVLGMLMGKTPRYIGKKIDAYDIRMVCMALLIPSICTLLGTAVACFLPEGVNSVSAAGPHGFTEILFAFSSVSNNNGGAFGGLASDTPFYNTALGICMWISRLFTMTALLAVAGNMASKPRLSNTVQAISTDGPVFSFVFIMVAFLVSMITFFPAMALGPIVESLQLLWGAGGM